MDVRECLEQQLDELDLLQCVFSQSGEFNTDDQAVWDQATAFVKRLTSQPPLGRLSCSLHLQVSVPMQEDEGDEGACAGNSEAISCDAPEAQCKVDICMRLPHSYPSEPPDVYVSSNQLSSRGQDDLNSDVAAFISSLPRGEVCLLSVAEWVRDNASSFCPITTSQSGVSELKTSAGAQTTFCRMWLYMHHIYSKTKRRNILDLADDLELSGFSLPGKPGIVCVEGDEPKTKHFYNILRRWNWKSITCRHREVVADCSDLASQRRISGFQELSLVTHGPKQNHMDMGQFRTYLEDHSLGYMFSQLFGVDGQTT